AQLFASRQALAHHAVTAMAAHAGGDEIAQPRETEEGRSLRAQGDAEARHLHLAARKKRRFGVVPQAQAIAYSGCDANHVLERAAQFHANEVAVGVNAKPIGGGALLNPAGQVAIRSGNHDRAGLAPAHLLGMTWPAKYSDTPGAEHVLNYLRGPFKGP